MCLLVNSLALSYPFSLSLSLLFLLLHPSSSDDVGFPLALPPFEGEVCVVRVCVHLCACTLFQEGPRAVHVISCLYMFQTSLATVEWRRDIWETERLNKTKKKKKIERKGKRGERGKQDDNKSSSDFTDAYFINHMNKSWWLCMAVAGRGGADYHTP